MLFFPWLWSLCSKQSESDCFSVFTTTSLTYYGACTHYAYFISMGRLFRFLFTYVGRMCSILELHMKGEWLQTGSSGSCFLVLYHFLQTLTTDVRVVQLFSGCLSHRGKWKTKLTNLPYSVTIQFSLHLIGQFGFSFFSNGISHLKSTVCQHCTALLYGTWTLHFALCTSICQGEPHWATFIQTQARKWERFRQKIWWLNFYNHQ